MNARFVPCDLSGADWKGRLVSAGFQCGLKSFASLLGISYYLDREAFARLLKMLGVIMCEGSSVCFDYPSAEDSLETRTNRALAQAANEQMKSQYTGDELISLLSDCGFLVYEHLDHQQMTSQYFSEYNRACPEHRMEAPKGVGYVHAVRKP